MLDLATTLILGSYLFGASAWVFLYREIRGLRNDIERLRVELAFSRGKEAGFDHEARITKLERYHTPVTPVSPVSPVNRL